MPQIKIEITKMVVFNRNFIRNLYDIFMKIIRILYLNNIDLKILDFQFQNLFARSHQKRTNKQTYLLI
jgi:hypothetical protein